MSRDPEFEMEILEQTNFNDPADVEKVCKQLAHYREDVEQFHEDVQLNGLVDKTVTTLLSENKPIQAAFSSLPSYEAKQLFLERLTQGVKRNEPRWRDEIRRDIKISNPFTKGL
jgi:hypothetical protein